MLIGLKAVIIPIPGGEVKYQCPRCWGVYNTREQAETIGQAGGMKKQCHRCRSRPMRSSSYPDTGESGETYDVEMASMREKGS